ncbi:Hpt domain-containing protein [Brevundimonas sp. NPDC046655]|uniref:Hpt domain-containing protein n=1 Tax=unclassified Brevundimonas TaxID=2622653 RepID=UPI00384E07B9
MNDLLASLRARFLDRCVSDLERIEKLRERDALNSEELQALVHRLAGAAGTFGFLVISDAAADCDDALVQGQAPDRSKVERLTAALEEALARRAD